MKWLAALAAVLLILPGASDAQPRRPQRPPAEAPAWTVDPAQSRIAFASSFGGTPFTGTFRRWTADIRFDPRNLEGSSVRAVIDTASAVTGSPDRDQTLLGPEWFNAAAQPRATFVARNFTRIGPDRYRAAGTLTIRGVSRPLTLPFSLVITGAGAQAGARMDARIGINRLAFGVGQGQWARSDVVPNRVDVTIRIQARRTSPPPPRR